MCICICLKLSPRLTFRFEEDVDPNIDKIQPKQNKPKMSKIKIIIIFYNIKHNSNKKIDDKNKLPSHCNSNC